MSHLAQEVILQVADIVHENANDVDSAQPPKKLMEHVLLAFSAMPYKQLANFVDHPPLRNCQPSSMMLLMLWLLLLTCWNPQGSMKVNTGGLY